MSNHARMFTRHILLVTKIASSGRLRGFKEEGTKCMCTRVPKKYHHLTSKPILFDKLEDTLTIRILF